MSQLPRGAGKLYLALIVVLAVVVWLTLKYEGHSAHFYGIAGTKEIMVNTEAAVEIKKIAVISGQTVAKGQLLVQLSSPEMTSKIAQLAHQIQELQATKGATKTELRARIAQLRAERATQVATINAQVSQLENQYRINKSLTSGLKSLRPETKKGHTVNPLTLRVAALKRGLALSLQPINIRIKALQQQITAPTNAAAIQVQRLQQQLKLLRAQNDKLKIEAQIVGVIGSVNFKAGEKVAPFAAILTLHAKTPSFIKGYIHENMHATVALDDKVKILSLAGGGVANTARPSFVGRVVGVGSRIVPYPKRLSKHQDIQLWGREILVRIPEQNDLILGEKVMIESGGSQGLLERLFGAKPSQAKSRGRRKGVAPLTAKPAKPKPVGSGEAKAIQDLQHHVEASAVHYLPDIKRYLLLSDDTPQKRPLLFLMDASGRVTDEVQIQGLKKVNDLEAIAAGKGQTLYLACSHSRSRKGKLKKSRRLLLRVKRQGKRFALDGKVDLHTLLNSAAAATVGAPWAKFIGGAADVDLEGLAYQDKALLLGYKAPLSAGRSVILRLSQLDALFDKRQIPAGAVSIFLRLRLQREGASRQEHLSGLTYRGGQLLITSTAKGQGSLWRLTKANTPELLRAFDGLRPEGLALSADPKQLIVVFDQGGKAASRFTLIKVVP
jgi:multidrug resistance efflux pump